MNDNGDNTYYSTHVIKRRNINNISLCASNDGFDEELI